ncbi:sensor histidine kinase [Streptomyces lunaelactis]|uniref:sensor histidine kinase n=1 Tax=Streptomyces lunaelactis TaxID=1535768 RepID=UPI0020C7995A|nr:hypothetical protein [Streptomyces lunaelactis]
MSGLEELRDGYADPSVEHLASLHDQALRLGRIVGDLGELGEAESARLSLHLAEVDLTALAGAAVAEREAELRTAGLTVRTVPGPAALLVRADADRLHQALCNLLSNAARHCRPGDTVTVTTSTTPFRGARGGGGHRSGHPRRRAAARLRPSVARCPRSCRRW